MSRRSATLNREVSGPYVEINPADAQRLSVNEGVSVRVFTRRGTITLPARVTNRVPEQVVFIPFHFVEASANELTNPALDPTAKIPEFKVCAAYVEPA